MPSLVLSRVYEASDTEPESRSESRSETHVRKNIGLRTFTVLLTEIFQVSRLSRNHFLDTPFHVGDTTSNYFTTFVLSELIILQSTGGDNQ